MKIIKLLKTILAFIFLCITFIVTTVAVILTIMAACIYAYQFITFIMKDVDLGKVTTFCLFVIMILLRGK